MCFLPTLFIGKVQLSLLVSPIFQCPHGTQLRMNITENPTENRLFTLTNDVLLKRS
jgi:hypothetical protein